MLGMDSDAADAILFTKKAAEKRQRLDGSTSPRTHHRWPEVEFEDSAQIAGCSSTTPSVRKQLAPRDDRARAGDARRIRLC